jgi:hypothetical protein
MFLSMPCGDLLVEPLVVGLGSDALLLFCVPLLWSITVDDLVVVLLVASCTGSLVPQADVF